MTKHVETIGTRRIQPEPPDSPAKGERVEIKSFMAEGRSWVGIQLDSPTSFMVFTPEQSRRIAIALRKHADRADKLFPQGKRKRRKRRP